MSERETKTEAETEAKAAAATEAAAETETETEPRTETETETELRTPSNAFTRVRECRQDIQCVREQVLTLSSPKQSTATPLPHSSVATCNVCVCAYACSQIQKMCPHARCKWVGKETASSHFCSSLISILVSSASGVIRPVMVYRNQSSINKYKKAYTLNLPQALAQLHSGQAKETCILGLDSRFFS